MINYEWELPFDDTVKDHVVTTINHILSRFLKNMDVEVLITSGEEIRRLNLAYRSLDKTTDVLSFPAFEGGPMDVDFGYLGSIAVSFDSCCYQAKEYGHSIKREMCFLCTHGMLHLLGYDHIDKKEEIQMKNLAEEILGELQINRD